MSYLIPLPLILDEPHLFECNKCKRPIYLTWRLLSSNDCSHDDHLYCYHEVNVRFISKEYYIKMLGIFGYISKLKIGIDYLDYIRTCLILQCDDENKNCHHTKQQVTNDLLTITTLMENINVTK